jgi:hypothetical protein
MLDELVIILSVFFFAGVLAAIITNLIMSIISVVCAICLIRGIKTENKKLMIPWLAVAVFTVGYMLVALIFSLVKVPTMAIGIALGLGERISWIVSLYDFQQRLSISSLGRLFVRVCVLTLSGDRSAKATGPCLLVD